MRNPQPAAAEPLTASQTHDVLRYWLATVRLEETLKTRPRARRVKHASTTPRLDFPSPGQEYFKVPLRGVVASVLDDEAGVQRPFDGELAAFFEGWLYNQYRRSTDDNELTHLLCFPVVHLPRGELAGLLRCGVRLRFGTGHDKPFRPPSYGERKRGSFPPAPDEVSLVAAPRGEGQWPFFIDTRLLSHPLGLTSDDIDALFDELRAHDDVSDRDMLLLVAKALEKAAVDNGRTQPKTTAEKLTPDNELEALLARVFAAVQALLADSRTRAEVYPVGVVIDGSQAKTTWHLQRELTQLLEEKESAFRPHGCLGRYLTGQSADSEASGNESPQRALFAGPALTAHQRSAAESFWGSTLTAVQGPPGTGKTTLILHLCAEALIRQVDGLLDRNVMGAELLMITSSNNRAVDNVIDPLSEGEGLPLALRVGSRQVCEQILATRLRHTIAWLEHAKVEPVGVHKETLKQALVEFASVRAELDVLLAPRQQALSERAKRTQLESAIAEATAMSPLASSKRSAATKKALSLQAARAIDQTMGRVERGLEHLSGMCTGKPKMTLVNAVARYYEKLAKKSLPRLESALTDAGLSFEVPLPPLATPLDVKALLEAWEEGAETFLERIAEVRELVNTTLGAEERAAKLRGLHEKLHALGPARDEPLPPPGGHDELSRALFGAAVRVREAWAKVHAEELTEAMTDALSVVQQDRSLRQLFRNDPETATLLCQLYGVWGSTLLSLGNCLPAEPNAAARVVIDEAGQCHPAHAVSALMRCKSAMVIGDVHQLTPVIELTADDDARILKSGRLTLGSERLQPYRVHSESHVSAQSIADRAVLTRHLLVDHFRCQPEIIGVSDALCGYGLRVLTPRVDYTLQTRVLDHPLSLLDVRGEQERVAGSLYNELEVRETLALVARLLARGAVPSDIAVITPYRGQLERLRRGLVEQGVPLEFSPELTEGDGPTPRSVAGLALGTVHRFQGGERRIVLFSSVVTRASSLPFLDARPNLLNVAVSRAEDHFVCLGDRSILSLGQRTRVLTAAAVPLTT
ncbi:MAG: hypothetical protein RLZZ450_5930 [Pseudomonadota bacterium]|jgi:hypothetical protein